MLKNIEIIGVLRENWGKTQKPEKWEKCEEINKKWTKNEQNEKTLRKHWKTLEKNEEKLMKNRKNEKK